MHVFKIKTKITDILFEQVRLAKTLIKICMLIV